MNKASAIATLFAYCLATIGLFVGGIVWLVFTKASTDPVLQVKASWLAGAMGFWAWPAAIFIGVDIALVFALKAGATLEGSVR